MKGFRKVTAAGARQAWLWRNRGAFGGSAAGEQPRLFVDVSTIVNHDARTGIQRVVRAVWSELRRRSGQGFAVQPVFATDARGYCCAPLDFLHGIGPDWVAAPVQARSGDKFLGLDLSAQLLPRYGRQLAEWRAHGATVHLLVYDLLPLGRPDWFNSTTVSNFRKWFALLANGADQAICISDDVAAGLGRHLAGAGRAGPGIVRMRMGSDIAGSIPSTGVSREVADLLQRVHSRRAVLMVGTVEPRKGYDSALAAFELLWRTDPDAPDLIIVGKPGWKTPSIQKRLHAHPLRGARLHWLRGASDEALCRLYEHCAGVFVASRGEGFGLPLVEAAQFRRHVLARDLPVFREQRLPNVSFFQGDSPPVIARRLMELAGAGQAPAVSRADLPTWSDCVDGLLRDIGLELPEFRRIDSALRKAS